MPADTSVIGPGSQAVNQHMEKLDDQLFDNQPKGLWTRRLRNDFDAELRKHDHDYDAQQKAKRELKEKALNDLEGKGWLSDEELSRRRDESKRLDDKPR
jgi:hypothetical protein